MKKKPTPITIWGGQLDDPPEYAMPIIRAIGLACLNWGRLEQHLQLTLVTVNKEEFDLTEFRETPATSFRLKIGLFKKWFVDDPRFAKYHAPAKRLVTSLKHGNRDRQLVFHSNLQRFEPGPPPKIALTVLRLKGENVIQELAVWTEKDLLNFSANIHKLNTGLRMISNETLTPDFLRSLESKPTRP